jgi:hypothetical protein
VKIYNPPIYKLGDFRSSLCKKNIKGEIPKNKFVAIYFPEKRR